MAKAQAWWLLSDTRSAARAERPPATGSRRHSPVTNQSRTQFSRPRPEPPPPVASRLLTRHRLCVLGMTVVGAVSLVPSATPLALISRSKAATAPAAAVLIAGDLHYELEIATTTAQQELGLGDRASLPVSGGMLFVFPFSSAEHCFWMKGMRFALDIIWLTPHDKVVSVEAHLF